MHPTFHEFCQFVAREARVGNGPRSARADLDIEEKAKPDHKKKQTTLNTHVLPPCTEKPAKPQGSPPIKCYYCREPHMLDKCAPFIQNSTEFKKAFVRERGLCFGCLKKGHTYRDCSVRNLEFMRDYPQNNKKGPTTMRTMAGEESSYASTVVPIVLYHRSKPDVRVCTYALMDTQSDSCFVQRGLAEQLGVLSHEEIDLELQTMGNKCKVRSEEIFGLMARGVSEDTAIPLPHCYTRDAIPGSRTAIPDPKLVRAWPHLEEVADNLQPRREDWDIGILLGYNCSDAMILVESRHKGCGYPFGLRTTLGWTVMGRLEDVERKPEKRQAVTFKTSARVVTSEEMKLMFKHDFATTKDDDEKMSYDNKCFMAKVTAGLKHRKDKHFEMPLPLREEPAELPDNRCAASKRLMISRRKLSKDEQLLGQYAEFMRGLIENGQAEEVPRPEEAPDNRLWYLSHQFVFHPKNPIEIRIIFDGSQEYMGVSLNGMLLTGPDMLNSLVGVLMRFREEKIGVMCDVEKMFHQVYVREEDRDFLRFLWFDEGDLDGNIKTYRMKVHLFGASSLPACANLALKATAKKFAEKYGEDVAAFSLHCFYVDDGLTSKAEPKQVLDLVRDSHDLCLEGGFNLRKFACTDRAVMEQIPKELRLADLKNWEAKGGSLPAERSLGLELGLEDDEFVFRVTLTEKPETRRGMLSSLSSVYDPLGLISAALLKGRLILQSLCCRDFGWDDEVPEDVRADWREWHGQLAGLSEIKIPRSCRKTANLPLTRTELHMFSDASTIGYGACAYLLLSDGENIDVTLIYAKSRVLPTKPMTVPRLEL